MVTHGFELAALGDLMFRGLALAASRDTLPVTWIEITDAGARRSRNDGRTPPNSAALARRQDPRRLSGAERQRAVDRICLQPGERGRGAAGEGSDEGRGETDRHQPRATAEAAWQD
jgi:hypothetical protein